MLVKVYQSVVVGLVALWPVSQNAEPLRFPAIRQPVTVGVYHRPEDGVVRYSNRIQAHGVRAADGSVGVSNANPLDHLCSGRAAHVDVELAREKAEHRWR